jgi:hypothetical protein
MSAEAAKKHTIQMIVFSAVLLVPAFFLLRSGHTGWAITLGLLAVVFFISAFTKKTLVAPCPYCDNGIYGILPGKRQEVRCSKCFEYSVVEGGKVRPMDPNISNDTPKFLSPVFEGAVWPPACVACGAPPARLDQLQDRSLNALGLAVGRVIISKASLSNVPYCNVHKDALKLNVSQTKEMDLKWCSLRMMRIYLALNRGKKSLGSKAGWSA